MKDDDLHAALARSELSGPEADAIWQRVAQDPRVRPKRKKWAWVGGGFAVAAAASIVLFLQPQVTSKGQAIAAVVDIDCLGPCRVGARIAVSVSYLEQPATLHILVDQHELSSVTLAAARHFTLREAPVLSPGTEIVAEVTDAHGHVIARGTRAVEP